MASILDILKKKNPEMDYAQAGQAMGIETPEVPQPEEIDNSPIEEDLQEDTQPENPELMDQVLSQTNTPDNPQQKNELPPLPEQRVGKELAQADKTAKDAIAEDSISKDPAVDELMPKTPAQEQVDQAPLQQMFKGHGTEATRENLLAAQQQENAGNNAALFAKLGARLGGAIGHQSESVIKDNEELANELSKPGARNKAQLMERIALEKEDPNSDYSKATRDFYKETFGKDLPEGISGQNVIDTMLKIGVPKAKIDAAMAQKLTTIAQQQKALEESTRHHGEQEKGFTERTKQLANMPFFNQSSRDDRMISQQLQQNNMKINDPNNRYNQQINRANNIYSTLGLDPDKTDVNKLSDKALTKHLDDAARTQVMETAMETAGLLTGGKPAVSTIQKLLPDNIKNRETIVQDFMSGNLNGAQQASFLKAMIKIADRVKTKNKQYLAQQEKALNEPLRPMIEQSKNKGLKERYKKTLENSISKTQTTAPAGVKMQAPDGTIRMVSPDQVDAAKAAGGIEVAE
jgi:hypothetical protein